jgi:hypothetical protein
MIWSLTVVCARAPSPFPTADFGTSILIVIGATLAWHFTRDDKNGVTQPSQHDFGLSPESSSARANNPLASLSLNAGPAKRTAIPVAHAAARRDRMHKQKRAPVADPLS